VRVWVHRVPWRSVVHENFGVLHMAQQKWDVAYDEFFAAFRSYSEAGNSAARTCLKSVFPTGCGVYWECGVCGVCGWVFCAWDVCVGGRVGGGWVGGGGGAWVGLGTGWSGLLVASPFLRGLRLLARCGTGREACAQSGFTW
jgi:hypothetical protein